MKRILVVTALLVLCLSLPGYAMELFVGPGQTFAKIQDAVNVAQHGDVITVMPGTYAEQVTVRNLDSLSLKGRNATITIPAAGLKGPMVKIVNCRGFQFTGFVVDGKKGVKVTPGAVGAGGEFDTRFYGLHVIDSSGHITKNSIKDVSWGNGVQQGNAIVVRSMDGLSREVNIQDNSIKNFQKNGITILGPMAAKINKNIVQGWGKTTVIAQNCLQLGPDPAMTASVTNNVITDAYYTRDYNWASTGILSYGNENVRIVNNTISDNMIGVYVYPGSTDCKIINNSGSGNEWDYYSYEADTKVHANKFED